ncbi:ribonuclease R [Aestuariispira ectoiniformans]|uniref:ribonuclease R n=1 Tax=Aestuariispira ectoiniformans TaxID=2775080 RepID=UPI00223A86F4|nr:ribonuclease R [Aestuariispira ectoiniformans]
MSKKEKGPVPLPTKEQVLEFINNSPTPVGKRELTRAFHIKGAMRNDFRALLKQLQDDGLIDRGRGRKMGMPGALPEVGIIEITEIDLDGELIARPVKLDPDEKSIPRILVLPSRRMGAAPKVGDRVLARLRRIGENEYEAQPIRLLKPGAQKILGMLEQSRHGCILHPTDRRNSKEYFIPEQDLKGCKPGDLALAEPVAGKALGIQAARVVDRVGAFSDPKAFSLIAIYSQGIPHEFSEKVLKETDGLKAAELGKRTDLRDVPLVTIDGADARDFDDAVWAEPDDDPKNEGGWHLLVAIADVSHYVTTDSALDKSALERGNSVYFPDRVVPMLPERLSNDLCSLRPNEDRACLAVHMWISSDGRLLRHQFVRGLMRSAARLTYEQVQKAQDGYADDETAHLLDPIIKPLYGAYKALARNRALRGTLELDIPERKVLLSDDDKVEAIVARDRLDSHKLIEEFMITANVAAAEALEAKKMPVMYRIHESPSLDKLEALRESLAGMGLKLPKGNVIEPQHFNGLFKQVAGTEKSHIVSEIVLRSQAQAVYSPENAGHFGLALQRYAHFTSPIRRYADLLVHRALIRGYRLGDGGLKDEQAATFSEIGEAISLTERRASMAERDVVDRYVTAYLADRIGAEFRGRINGVTHFGLFVTLDETGADGLIPVSSLPFDRYVHDETAHALIGTQTGLTYTLGEKVTVSLSEADTVTGGMVFVMVEGGKIDTAAKKHARRLSPKGKRGGPRGRNKSFKKKPKRR